jgi:imidazolonepropionase-like amidohydrolase
LLADPDTQPKSEQSILIEGERIKAVSGGFIDPPPGGELIDLRKKFVLPGLIDCHVHLTAQLDRGYRLRSVEDSDPKVGFNAAHNAAVTLGAGFTTVRDVGAAGNPEIIFALRAAVAERKVAGPRILCVGAVLSPTGGHGQTYGYRHDVCACVQSTSGICDGVDECRRAVRRQVSHGADAIKFVATGGVLSNIKAGLDQQFTDDEIRSIIETAHRLGRRVAAHAHGAAGINAALETGVDSIEHGSDVTGQAGTYEDFALPPGAVAGQRPPAPRGSSPGIRAVLLTRAKFFRHERSFRSPRGGTQPPRL